MTQLIGENGHVSNKAHLTAPGHEINKKNEIRNSSPAHPKVHARITQPIATDLQSTNWICEHAEFEIISSFHTLNRMFDRQVVSGFTRI